MNKDMVIGAYCGPARGPGNGIMSAQNCPTSPFFLKDACPVTLLFQPFLLDTEKKIRNFVEALP